MQQLQMYRPRRAAQHVYQFFCRALASDTPRIDSKRERSLFAGEPVIRPPIAGTLDLGVIARDEIEKTLAVAPHEVTGPDRHIVRRSARFRFGRRTVALSGACRVVPVAKCDACTHMHELAGFIGSARCAVLPDDEHPRIGNGLADRVGPPVDLCRIEKRGTERLGQPIHQEGRGSRKQRPEFLQHGQWQATSRVREVSEIVARPVGPRCGCKLHP